MKMNRIVALTVILMLLFTSAESVFALEESQSANAQLEETNKNKKSDKEKKQLKEQKEAKRYIIPVDKTVPENLEEDTITMEGSVSTSLALGLADCLELALVNNPKIKSAYLSTAISKTLKKQTLSNYSPRVNIEGSFSRIKPDMSSFDGFKVDPFNKYIAGSIGIRQLVYDFGLTQNLYTIDKINYDITIQNTEEIVNTVISDVKKSYYGLVAALEKKRVMLDTVDKFQETYNQALAFYEVGTRAKIDVTIAATNLANAKVGLIQANNDVNIAVATLNNAMGTPFIPAYTIQEELPVENIDLTLQQLVDIANNNRPALKMAALQVQTNEQTIKLAKKVAFPSLEFQGNWTGGGKTDGDYTTWYNLGGYLTFPAINPFLLKNQVDEAKKRYEKQQYDSDSALNDIYFEIQTCWANFKDAREKIPVAKLAMEEALENYELSNGRYKVGECDAVELKDAQLQYQNARLEYYNTLYLYNSQKAMLEKAVGQTLKVRNDEEVNGQEENSELTQI